MYTKNIAQASVALVFLALSVTAMDISTETVDGIEWSYEVEDGEAQIFNEGMPAIDTATSGDITVPSTLGGYPVTSIGYYAFKNCASLTTVSMPDGVRSI